MTFQVRLFEVTALEVQLPPPIAYVCSMKQEQILVETDIINEDIEVIEGGQF